MVPLFKKICMNTATFLTQSGGNPLIERKKSKYEPLLTKSFTVSYGNPVIKTVEKVDLKTATMGKIITLD